MGLENIPERLQNPVRLFVRLLVYVWTTCNESVLRIQTEPPFGSPPLDPAQPWKGEATIDAKHSDNHRYGTIGYRHIRRILQVLDPGPEDVFYDIGCGMGRVLCVAAQRPLRQCVGIELMETLCQAAQRNAASLRGRKAPIRLRCEDAARADLADGTIYFMFNPFGPETLRDTLERIRGSLQRNPRAVKIVYYSAKHRSVVERMEWLNKVRHFESFGGHPVTIWENRDWRDAAELHPEIERSA